jgi:hypothetical protein
MSDTVQQPCKQVGYRRARRHIEAVADRLDECLRDQALSGQGWDGLASLWRSAERVMSNAEDYLVWHGDDEENRAEHRAVIREYLIAVAATLLDLSTHIESMRRCER